MSDLKIVVPSHKRAGRVDTPKHIRDCVICVPESQMPEYLDHHAPNELLSHPDSVTGMYAKRNWILETFKGVPIFLADDDVVGLKRMWIPPRHPKKSKLTADEARTLIESLYQTATELGAHMFGFANSGSPLHYQSRRPLRFGHSLHGTCQGFLPGHQLSLPPERKHVGSDLYVSLLCMYRHRYMLIDTRFFVDTRQPLSNPGGMREFESAQRNAEAMRFLVRCFGRAVHVINAERGRAQAQIPWVH